ncbi:MAG: RNB domain-containing ribonuclease, partial [Planctomycetota bacterium]
HVEPHDGGTRLWIHSPTLAERLSPGNALDLWLRDQAEAICLGDVWQPLLTRALIDASRFSVGEAQDAISVRLDCSADGELRDWAFCLSRIQPVASVSAEALQALAARKPKARTVPAVLKPIKDQIGQLETLLFCARSLQADALRRGGIELDLPAPELESLGDLRDTWPDPGRHAWLPPLNPEDPQAILSLLLEAAARAGDGQAQTLLGTILEGGFGVPAAPQESVSWHRRAAERGVASSQHKLGLALLTGRGTPVDPRAAATWLTRAAERNVLAAQTTLGLMHLHGRGVSQDDALAVAWLRRAAQRDEPIAQHHMGLLFLRGRGVPKDEIVAARLLQAAADRGVAEAQLMLAGLYEHGVGVPEDRITAYAWLTLAQAAGNARAAEERFRLADWMTYSERIAAETRASDWQDARASRRSYVAAPGR